MFATILGLPDAVVGIIGALCLILWGLKDAFKAANGPVGKGIWDIFTRGR